MLTQEDIQKIVKANQRVFTTKEDLVTSNDKILKEVFATKEELVSFRESILEVLSDLQGSVDAYTKKADTYFQEMVMLSHKIDRHEKWLMAMAEKLGMKLEY